MYDIVQALWLCLHYNSQIFTLIHQRLLINLINVRILLTSFLQNISSSSGSRFKDDNDEEEYKENSLLNHFFFHLFFLICNFYNSMSFFLNEKQQHCKRITDRRTDARSYSFYRICCLYHHNLWKNWVRRSRSVRFGQVSNFLQNLTSQDFLAQFVWK